MSRHEQVAQLATRSALRLLPDPRRVIAMPVIPGEEMPGGNSRALAVVARILAMDDADMKETLAETKQRFSSRHRDLEATWSNHFHLAAHHLGDGSDITADRELLIGAYFTREVSVESAALFNPSIVAHPDQSGVAKGEMRVVLSLRAVGEGHVSSIEFRTGIIDAIGNVTLEDPGVFLDAGRHSPGPYDRNLVHAKLAERGFDHEAAALVLDRLSPSFSGDDLDASIKTLHRDLLSKSAIRNTLERIRWVAASNYTVVFSPDATISEQVLCPSGPAESHGLEDARFVRFVDDDGTVTYFAPYTAYDGANVAQHLLWTTDFRTFVVSQLSGKYATNKGLAIFPRKVGGRYLALSRWDRERLAISMSDDCRDWSEASTLRRVPRPWELVQIGNCGSPLETSEGWLVLTHGVGPMHEYAIGAMLLDLEDPRRVIGTLADPLLVPNEEEREGYVPNVVYSCGSLIHDANLILPYGFADCKVGFARVNTAELLGRLMSSDR